MKNILVELLCSTVFLKVQRNLFIGEEHEVMNQYFGRLLESFLRMNTSIRRDLQIQFLIIGLLLHTVVLNCKLHIANRCVNRIDRQQTKLCIGRTILLCRDVTTTLGNRQLNLKLYIRIQATNYQFWIQYLEVGQEIRDIACGEFTLTGNIHSHLLTIDILDGLDETYLLELQNDLKHSFHNTGDRSKLMIYTGNLDRRDRIALQRREQNAPQRIADGHAKSGLERTKFKPSERRGGFEHDYLFRFLKC